MRNLMASIGSGHDRMELESPPNCSPPGLAGRYVLDHLSAEGFAGQVDHMLRSCRASVMSANPVRNRGRRSSAISAPTNAGAPNSPPWVRRSVAARAGCCCHGPRDSRLVNQWASDHCHTLAGGTPILASMYKHSYHMDYSAKAARRCIHDRDPMGQCRLTASETY
jgi:hypothetical protein